MLLKRFLLLLILLFSVINIYSIDCSFEYAKECSRTSSSFNTFNLNFNPNDDFSHFDATLYNKENPSNKITLSKEGNSVKNIVPLIEPGVYILEVEAYNKGYFVSKESFEFVFDNLNSMPPLIPITLISQGSSIDIEGETQFKNTNVIVEVEGSKFETISGENNQFTLLINNLRSGINYAKFYTINSNGIKSSLTERIIVGTGYKDVNEYVSSITISSLETKNEKTIKQGNDYITSKRNFYVFGNAVGNKGAKIYVNGVRAIFDGNNFGAFVLLNEGENTITIQSKNVRKSFNVIYDKFKFNFEEINFEKIVNGASTTIYGKTNFDLPFNIYLNGEYKFSHTATSGSFSFELNNLINGKNYIYLEGLNGEKYFDIIYKDSEEPVIEILSHDYISKNNNFIFKATDDLGIDSNSIEVTFSSSNIFNSDEIELSGDFYEVDISDLSDGTYNYNIYLKDRVGNEKTKSGSISISSSNTIIDSFEIEGGYVKGNNLFVKSGEQKIILIPSRFIAFESIFIDGKEQTNYDIKYDGSVTANLEFNNEEGEVQLVLINNNYEKFIYKYKYYTDEEMPQIKVDYITKPFAISNENILVSGEVLDSHFDWSSLSFNGENSFIRFGNYFEAYVKPTSSRSSNLEIFGSDFTNNAYDKNIGSILYLDNSNSKISNGDISSNDNYYGAIISEDLTRVKNFVYYYDGFELNNVFLERNDLKLPVQQRNGVRSLNLKGLESSEMEIFSSNSYSIDGLIPKAYLVEGNSGKQNLIIDGTLSSIDKESIKIAVASQELSPLTLCSSYTKISINDICYEFNANSGDTINLEVKDSAGNILKTSFSAGNYDTLQLGDSNIEIFFNGNDKITSNKNSFVQGQIISNKPLTSVSVSGKSCIFDEHNFVCYVELEDGENNIIVTAKDSSGLSMSNNFSQYLETMPPEISINNIDGSGLYNIDDNYFYVRDLVDLSAVVDSNSIVKLVIDGRKSLIGKKLGDFNVQIDLTSQVSGKSEDKFDIWLEAEDNTGNVGVSEKVEIYFKRIIDTIITIVVG